MSLEEFLSIKDVLICVGSGGVGKTTTAAAVSVKVARLGRKVLVCTIDPARRLATSLGLSGLDNSEARVATYPGGGELWAMMLDVKTTFDDVVREHAADAEAARRILDNRYYRTVSAALSVSQEFMAVEKLYALHRSGRYDVIVLDTPPTKNTIDFLKTPSLVVAAMDARFIKWILKPYQLMKSGRRKGILAIGAEKVFQGLGRLFGLEALMELSEFVAAMQGLIGGFRERSASIRSLITSAATGFVIVSTARERSIEEGGFFYREIEGMDADVIAVVLNRMKWPAGAPEPESWEPRLEQLPRALRDKARRDLERLALEGAREEGYAAALEGAIPPGIIQRVPQLARDIHDLEGLEAYAALLA